MSAEHKKTKETTENAEGLAPEGVEGATESSPNPASETQALKDQLLRALAEAENVKRRADRDKQEAFKYAITNFARDLLTVADNFDRALQVAPKSPEDQAMKNFLTGVELTQKELQSTLTKHGVEEIKVSPGDAFDYNTHQAMSEVESPDKPSGTIVQVLQKGYALKDRLLRPAMVVISKGGTPADGPPETDRIDTTA